MFVFGEGVLRESRPKLGAFRMPLARPISVGVWECVGEMEVIGPANKFVGQWRAAPDAAVASGARLIPACSDCASLCVREVVNLSKSVGRADELAKGFDEGLGALPLFDGIGYKCRWLIAK
jgi:hypothetical protein